MGENICCFIKVHNLKIIKMNKVFILLLFLNYSCNLREIKYNDEEIYDLKYNILNHNDSISYEDYSLYLSQNKFLGKVDLLPYSLKICKKYPNAYYNFFQSFLKIKFNGKFQSSDIINLEKPEQELLIFYLNEGAKKSGYYCRLTLEEYYRKGIYYKKDLKKADSIYKAIYGQPYINKTK
jgi:hypothetical protein